MDIKVIPAPESDKAVAADVLDDMYIGNVSKRLRELNKPKYAGRTGTPIPVMLGLPEQETGWGKRPYYNFSNDISKRALGNADYFKAFGYIPQEYLVRDFRYNDDLNGGKEPVPVTTPPLQHAFEYFNSGNYNRGDASHTSDVVNAGNALWNESTGNLLKWWNTEGKYWYDKGRSHE